MSSRFGITTLIPGLPNEVALEIFHYFVTIDWDGPFPLILVCRAWRDMVLSSPSLKCLRRDRRRPKPALIHNPEKAEGICILSLDGGGPSSMSQLRILDEIMMRLAFKSGVELEELLPADYFDLMGGVGFGGLAALLLGRLRMTTSQAMEELAAIGTEIFPGGEGIVTMEVNTTRLRRAMESMLERHGHSVDLKMREIPGKQCKVVLFAAPAAVMDHCQPFRTYRSPHNSLECTLVDAACATMSTPQHFSPVAVGPHLRKQDFAGIPHGFNNPTREVLREAQLVFGGKSQVSLVLSLGAGQRASLSGPDEHTTRLNRIHCDTVARELQHQLRGFGEYIRLNVDRGLDTIKLDDWQKLGSIETHTNVYLGMSQITTCIDKAFQWLLQRGGSTTLGQLSGTSVKCVAKFPSETFKDYLEMEFKQMHDVIRQGGIAKITLVDAIGNDIPIPMQFCVTYDMLLEVIRVYFRHQGVPGKDFVERGDYRLVHGNRRNVVRAIEWTGIEKVGLKVEMSMILRTRDEDEKRCPSCRTLFEGSASDGWARCLSCSGHFQTETKSQAETNIQLPLLWVKPSMEIIQGTPAVETYNRAPVMGEGTSGGMAVKLPFRLISVIKSPYKILRKSVNEDVLPYSFRGDGDRRRRMVLEAVLSSSFVAENTLEPLITGAGDALITGVGEDMGMGLGATGKSIYTVFLEQVESGVWNGVWRCLFGDLEHPCSAQAVDFRRLERALDHVRSHLNHRPFGCTGICQKGKSCAARFYARSHLQDHVRRTESACCEICGQVVRVQNMPRHRMAH